MGTSKTAEVPVTANVTTNLDAVPASRTPSVSTIVVSYNHQEFIADAIESALAQHGDFDHEILLSDDGSTDGTARIVEAYAQTFPGMIRNISRGRNFGISENYKHAFRQAKGEFVAILEADDYWSHQGKNLAQVRFLQDQEDAAIVFSRIERWEMSSDRFAAYESQQELPRLLTGRDLVASGDLNPIINLSSTMLRRSVVIDLPDFIFRPRLSEIVLAFHLETMGPIGFIDELMGVYRITDNSVWSGAGLRSRLEQAIAIREVAARVARPDYRAEILRNLDGKKRELAVLGSKGLPDSRYSNKSPKG